MSTADAEQEPTKEVEKSQVRAETSNELVSEDLVKLKNDLEDQKKKSSDLSKRMMYLQADLLNLQRQSDRRESQAREDVKLGYLLELASINEDLERALSASGTDISKTLRDGLAMVISRIDSDLKAESIERMKISLGAVFDPHLHEAVAYAETNDKNDGRILSVVGNGYTYKGKVIKPALVEVARKKQSTVEDVHTEEDKGVDGDLKAEERAGVGALSSDRA